MHQDIISWYVYEGKIDAVFCFHSRRVTCVIVMIVRLDQTTKHAILKMCEFQKYAFHHLHESVVIVLHFDERESLSPYSSTATPLHNIGQTSTIAILYHGC